MRRILSRTVSEQAEYSIARTVAHYYRCLLCSHKIVYKSPEADDYSVCSSSLISLHRCTHFFILGPSDRAWFVYVHSFECFSSSVYQSLLVHLHTSPINYISLYPAAGDLGNSVTSRMSYNPQHGQWGEHF